MGNHNSGRRPDREKWEITKKLRPLEPRWLRAVAAGLEANDPAICRLFAEYAYGKPTQRMDITSDDEPMQMIAVQIVRNALINASSSCLPPIDDSPLLETGE